MPDWIRPKVLLALIGLTAIVMLGAVGCGAAATPQVVEKKVVVEKEVIKEVPKEVVVEKQVVKEVEKQVVVVVTPTPQPVKTLLFALSSSSPHISVIDTETNRVITTADLPYLTSWNWNDNNNYFDGQSLWLGMIDPKTTDAEVIGLNLDNLVVTSRFPIGKEKNMISMGKAARNGVLHIGKMASGQVVTIDTKNHKLLSIWDVPVNEGVVCDVDLAVGPDGIERFYYVTRHGNTLVSINPETGETLKVVEFLKGSNPWMVTTAPDGKVWVQEGGSNTNSVFDPVTLDLIKRFPAGKLPVVGSFSPEGKYAYIGHMGDTIVQVVNAQTFEEVKRITVGTNPQKLAVHPNGKSIYAVLNKEASVAVIDTGSWEVTRRIPLGTNADGVYLRVGSR